MEYQQKLKQHVFSKQFNDTLHNFAVVVKIVIVPRDIIAQQTNYLNDIMHALEL